MNALICSGLCFLLLLPLRGDSIRQGRAAGQPSGLALRSIEACRIRMKALSANADFVGRWLYTGTVNSAGVVETISEPDDSAKTARFVELADFESCVRRWRFVKSGNYSFLLLGGTMSDGWSVTVSNGAESLRVAIPTRPSALR